MIGLKRHLNFTGNVHSGVRLSIQMQLECLVLTVLHRWTTCYHFQRVLYSTHALWLGTRRSNGLSTCTCATRWAQQLNVGVLVSLYHERWVPRNLRVTALPETFGIILSKFTVFLSRTFRFG